MSNRAHSGRCFRQARHTAERKRRQGVTAKHVGMAHFAQTIGAVRSWQTAIQMGFHGVENLIRSRIAFLQELKVQKEIEAAEQAAI